MNNSQVFLKNKLCWVFVEFLLAFSSCPILNNVNIHDICFNENVLSTYAILYDSSNIDNVQVAYRWGQK
jgi:hypothetical protein